LRHQAKVLFGISRGNLAQDRPQALTDLRDSCEEMKLLIQISKELKAFKKFKQFEYSSLLIVTICRQSQAWLKATSKKSLK